MTSPEASPKEIAWDQIRQACKLTNPQAAVLSCILTGVMAAMPTFLAAFMDCLAGGPTPGPGQHTPGTRSRCQQ